MRRNNVTGHDIRRFFVVVLLLLALSSPAFAGTAARHQRVGVDVFVAARPAVVLADSWGIGRFFSAGGRARVVQISVVAMSIALFIMMRKFNG